MFDGAVHVDVACVGITGAAGRSGICGGGGIIDTDGGFIDTDGGIIDVGDGGVIDDGDGVTNSGSGCGSVSFDFIVESGGCWSLLNAVSQRAPQVVQKTAFSRVSLPHLLHVIFLLLMPFLCGRDNPAPT